MTGIRQRGPVLHAIVLAAGASSRFGSPKQLASIDGKPMLKTVVTRTVEAIGISVTVVLGANAAKSVAQLARSPASICINRGWKEGMASSIRAGVQQLPASCRGVMIVLADQAAVTVEDLGRLASTWRRQPLSIVAARYGRVVGAPAIFPRSTFGELAALRGDRGARAVILRHPDRVAHVPMARAAIDIDTPEDLPAARHTDGA